METYYFKCSRDRIMMFQGELVGWGVNWRVHSAPVLNIEIECTSFGPCSTESPTKIIKLTADDQSIRVGGATELNISMNPERTTVGVELIFISMHPTYEEAAAAQMKEIMEKS